MPWVTYLGSLVGIACAVVVVLQFSKLSTTALNVQTRPTQPVSYPVQPALQSTSLEQPTPPSLLQKVGNGLAAISLATMANLGTPYMTPAAEVDVLSTPTPSTEYIFDDGELLSKSTLSDLQNKLPLVEAKTGYRINVVTLRKLVAFEDAFQFADNLIETWYPTAELGDKKAVFVIVKNSKEGGLVGGPSFSKNVPGSVIESIINDNVGKLVTQEKFNQAITSTVSRLETVLSGKPDPGPPRGLEDKEQPQQTATYKSKDETDSKRGVYTAVFGALVAISFIAPMVQFFGYTKDDQ